MKTFKVVCNGKVISKHLDFYHAQVWIPVLFKQGRINNNYKIEPITKKENKNDSQ